MTIRRGDVARLLDDIEKTAPSQADHVLGIMSKLCNWYMARQETYTTPIVRGLKASMIAIAMKTKKRMPWRGWRTL